MLNYLSHKLRMQTITDGNNVHEKIDDNDSGTESDGVIDDVEERFSKFDIVGPFDTNSLPSYVSKRGASMSGESTRRKFLNIVTSSNCLMYDQHSSEEELEVINGSNIDDRVDVDDLPETMLDIDTFKSSPSTTAATCTVESRKRSIAQSSDDEVRNYLENMPAPVANFRTSPPIEAVKPLRGTIVYRSKTPLILADCGRGLENIKISCDNADISMDMQSISPPAKLFHCSVSPRRRQIKSAQRLQRPHRPCLDFDKMQQVTKIL